MTGIKTYRWLWIVLILAFSFSFLAGCKKKETPVQKKPKEKKAFKPISAKEVLDTLGPAPSAGYDIYAIRVGKSQKAKKKFFFEKATSAERAPIDFSFWALAGQDKIILIDSGFVDKAKIDQWKVVDYRLPLDGLKAAGLDPDKVTDIIATHRHWDHIGGVGLFPKATIHIAKAELIQAMKRYEKKDPALFAAMEKAEIDGRIKYTQKLEQIFPGVAVVRQGKHTRNIQSVVVNNTDGIWVIASDEGPLYENYDGPIPSGQTKSREESIAALKTLSNLVDGKTERIIPGHEPLVFERFEKVAPGVVRISNGLEEK